MVQKIAISISKELNSALTELSTDRDLPKSRLIEICLRENPEIVKAINSYALKSKTVCNICREKIAAGAIKIDTPAYGVICKDCWTTEAGALVIQHPIADTNHVATVNRG
jgi:hypothetical protein